MESISSTSIFWFIALGLTVGAIFGLIVKKEGVSVKKNIIAAVFASILTGSMAIIMGFGDGLLFALLGTLAILFLVNAFHQHHEEDIFGHVDRRISLKK